MDWNGWTGKQIFLRTKSGKVFSGIVDSVEEAAPIIFINLTDKFGYKVTIATSEIIEIKEEKK